MNVVNSFQPTLARLARGMALALLFTGVLHAVVHANDVRRPGVIQIIQDGNPSETLGGNIVVGDALAPNRGMIRFVVEQNPYFTIQDVASWLRESLFELPEQSGFVPDLNRIVVQPDESIVIRFANPFIGDATVATRRFQIRHPQGHFSPYFQSHQIYESRVVTYIIRVASAPIFETTAIPTGTFRFLVNEDQADIVLNDDRGVLVGNRTSVLENPEGDGYLVEFENIPVNQTYIVRARKEGFQTITLTGLTLQSNQVTVRNIDFAAQAIGTGLGRIVVQSNLSDVDIVFEYQDGVTRENRRIIDGYLSTDVRPGRYRVTFAPEGFIPFQDNIMVRLNEVEELDLIMQRAQPVAQFLVESSPSGATVFVDGRQAGTTPLTLRNFSREESIIRLERRYFSSVVDTVQFLIEEAPQRAYTLEPSYITVSSNPQSLITVDGQTLGLSTQRISEPSQREYLVRLEANNYLAVDTLLDMRTQRFVDLYVELERGISRFDFSPKEFPIRVNVNIQGSDYNRTLEDVVDFDLNLPYDVYDITIRRPGFRTYNGRHTIRQPDFDFEYELSPKSKFGTVFRSMILPGAGQINWGHGGRGTLFLLPALGVIGYGSYLYAVELPEIDSRIEDLQAQYLSASTQVNINRLRNELIVEGANRTEVIDQLNLLVQIYAGIWAVNVLERILFVPTARRTYRNSLRNYSGPRTSMSVSPTGVGLTISLD